MGDRAPDLTQEQIRESLLEKIRAASPGLRTEAAEKALRLASNDDLRRFLAISHAVAEVFSEPWAEVVTGKESHADVRDSGNIIVERTGAELPLHTYALAKDTFAAYKGPNWCPVNLWSAYKHGAHGTDSKVTRECAEKLIYSAGAAQIWRMIAERYPRPDRVALTLPSRCADFIVQWRATPKRTPGEHLKNRLALQSMAEELATELDKYFDRLDAPYFLNLVRGVNFPQLMSEDQRNDLDGHLKWHNHVLTNQVLTDANVRRRDWNGGEDAPSHQTWELLFSHDPRRPGIIPTLQEQLRLVGAFFAHDGMAPPISRPNSKNAERNYFARRLIRYFIEEHGEMSPTIVANITSIFFEQGISDNDVAQMVGASPSG